MYKLASKSKLRFLTEKGNLSTEQLWDLSIEELDKLAIQLEIKYQSSGKKSFIRKKTKKDKIAKLKFNLVFDILTTKVEERDYLQNQAEIKAHNQKILSFISEKENEKLKSKSLNELKKLIK